MVSAIERGAEFAEAIRSVDMTQAIKAADEARRKQREGFDVVYATFGKCDTCGAYEDRFMICRSGNCNGLIKQHGYTRMK